MSDGNAAPVFRSNRSRNLSFAKENSDYNRTYFNQVRARAAAGEPFAFVNADVPTEIFKAMDIPVIVNQWWGAVVAAKQKSPTYLARLDQLGYRRNLCAYCSLSYASAVSDDPDVPWGGLPRPTMLVSGNDCGSLHHIFEAWAEREAIPFFRLHRAAPAHPPPVDWLDDLKHGWERVFGSSTIDVLADQYRDLIAFLENSTGRTLDPDRLRDIVALSNEQEEYYGRTRDLIVARSPAPLNVADQMPATMIPQWHRGTEWGRDRARLFYEETAQRTAAGESVADPERFRLMWLGTGLWYNLDFYEYFQETYGAVFVWSMYLAVAADAYPTYGNDPLRVLAARMTKIQCMLNVAPYNVEWFQYEARRARIDGVVSMSGGTDDDCRESFGQHYLLRRAFEQIGVPILRLGVDNADARAWDDQAVREKVGSFLDTIDRNRASVRSKH